MATAEESQHAAVAAATAGQKAAAARMKQKLTQLSPTKGQLQHTTGDCFGDVALLFVNDDVSCLTANVLHTYTYF